jgi:hypothetical protein
MNNIDGTCVPQQHTSAIGIINYSLLIINSLTVPDTNALNKRR